MQGFSLVPLAILSATFLVYVDTLILGFVFDDHVLIVTNDSIRSWRYFPSYFTSHIWAFQYPHLLANYYRPLFLTWLRLNEMLFGLHPWGWHLMSVLAHVAVTYIVYRLAMRLTQNSWVAAVAALLFGLHPVHAEAVADITSIQEPLSTLFILAAVLAFARSREQRDSAVGTGDERVAGSSVGGVRSKGWLAASLGFTAASLLTKESGMVTPLLIFFWVCIYGPTGGGEARTLENSAGFFTKVKAALVASIPFWLVVLAYVPARIRALKGFAHVITPLPLSKMIYTIPSVLVFYLRLLFWPTGLSCYYDTPYLSTPDARAFVLPVALLAAVVVAVVILYMWLRQISPQSARAVAFAAFWTVLTILPVLNFHFLPEGEIAHDRYIYLPSIGFFILVAMALGWAFRSGQRALRKDNRAYGETQEDPPDEAAINDDGNSVMQLDESRGKGWLVGALLAALFVALGLATARQNLFWANDFMLNYRAHEIAPKNVYATTSLAAAVAEQGMQGAAIDLYHQALAIQPKFWRANVNLGYLEYARGDYGAAAHYFATACESDPTDGDQFLYLGMSLLRMGRFTEAEEAVRSALLVRPQGKNYHLGLGMVLRGEGRLSEAKQEIVTELARDPENPQARNLLEQVTRQIEGESGKPGVARPKDHPRTDMK